MMRVALLALILIVGELIVTTSASATSVKLHQSISPLDCTVTDINTGSGTSTDSSCAPLRPVISSVDVNGGRPIIRGLFNAVGTLTLRVFFAGKWYTLGVDPELTASGNVWTLDLSGLKSPLPPGNYRVEVQARVLDGALYSNSRQVTIKAPASAGSNEETLPPKPTNHNSYTDYITVGVLAMIVIAASLLLVARRRRTE